MLNVEKYLEALVSHEEIICIKESDDSLHFCGGIKCGECQYCNSEYDDCCHAFVAWMFDEYKERDDSEVIKNESSK